MRKAQALVAAVVLVFLCSSTAQAQSGEQRRAQGPVERLFWEAIPEIGEEMPDVAIYDAEGREVRLHELIEGQHTVFILGCLT